MFYILKEKGDNFYLLWRAVYVEIFSANIKQLSLFITFILKSVVFPAI